MYLSLFEFIQLQMNNLMYKVLPAMCTVVDRISKLEFFKKKKMNPSFFVFL